MKLEYSSKTDIGGRTENQDCIYANEPLFIVADGMGWHNCGALASKMAVDMLADLKEPSKLQEYILSANEQIYEKGNNTPECKRMGTTLTAAYIEDEKLYI